MRRVATRTLRVLASLAVAVGVCITVPSAQSVALFGRGVPTTAGGSSGGTLIQQGNMVFVGAFRLPSGTVGNGDWSYGGYGLEYDASVGTYGGLISANGSRRLGEYLVPNPATWSTSATITSLPQTTMSQNLGVVDDDDYTNDPPLVNGATDNGVAHGDCKFWSGSLFCTDYVAYDADGAGGKQAYAMFKRGSNFSVNSFLGWVRILSGFPINDSSNTWSSQHPVSGYLAVVPSAYRSTLGKMIVGNAGGNIISTTSSGPSAFLIDPDTYTFGSSMSSTDLVWYYGGNSTIGQWDPRPCTSGATGCGTYPSDKSYDWTGNATATGAVFPTGWRTMLVVGRGTASFCYGQGTPTAGLDGQNDGAANEVYCYDPWDTTKGTHSDSRTAHVWVYDINDLISAKNGSKLPYNVVPYSHWTLTLPTGSGTCGSNGVSDNAPVGAALGSISGTEYLFISFYQADKSDLSCRPLIGAYKFQ